MKITSNRNREKKYIFETLFLRIFFYEYLVKFTKGGVLWRYELLLALIAIEEKQTGHIFLNNYFEEIYLYKYSVVLN